VSTSFLEDGVTLNFFFWQVTQDVSTALTHALSRAGLLTKDVLLLHDNARPHTANKTNEKL
jgi:hypothetical protein